MTDAYDVLVIGAGPSGCAAAATLARAGKRVVLLDKGVAQPPFGQALRPGVIPILDAIGALPAIEAAGFARKSGSTHWGWGRTDVWDLWFADSEIYDYAWFVERVRFDAILLDHAVKSGAERVTGANVRRLVWEDDRLVGVEYDRGGRTVEVRARYVFDASGRAQTVGRALGLYEDIAGLRHQAFFAQYEGVAGITPPRERQALFLAQSGHWFWMFPMAEGRTSLGMVLLDDEGGDDEPARMSAFDAAVAASDRLRPVLGPSARRVTPVQRRRDWSYRMKRVAGPGWFLLGDAAGFIDPVLAQGVVMALNTGYITARLVLAAMEGRITDSQAAERYQREHADHFEDLVQMLRFFYVWDVDQHDYFWESKRILERSRVRLKPQKAFAMLTSGLIRNLAFDEKVEAVDARRAEAVGRQGTALDAPDAPDAPDGAHQGIRDRLDFIGVHLDYHHPKTPGMLYLLVEPRDPSAPALFRTLNWDVNVMSRRFKDPLRDPLLGRVLRAFTARMQQWDCVSGESLAAFWQRVRVPFRELLAALPRRLELVRVFGE